MIRIGHGLLRVKDSKLPARMWIIRVRFNGTVGGDTSFQKLSGRRSVFQQSQLVPQTPPIGQAELEDLVNLLRNSKRTTVLTGAGVSTASGIPDYRGPGGAYTRVGYKPMSHQTFMATEAARSRYWLRNFVGWEQFKDSVPNASHLGITELQTKKWMDFIITQNVDRLHHKAGSTDIIELRGTTYQFLHYLFIDNREMCPIGCSVTCTECGDLTDRAEFQTILSELNPSAKQMVNRESGSQNSPFQRQKTKNGASAVRPDGDVDVVEGEKDFVVPSCLLCGGILKPNVVFFGDSVPKERASLAHEVCSESEALLVIGSSVAVYSAYRLVRAAKENSARIAIINVGKTRADDLCDIKVECVAGEVLSELASHPSLLATRIRQSAFTAST